MSNPVALEQGRSPIDVRIRMSALWVATMLVFLYVDLFSLYRADVRQDLDEGRIFAFEVRPAVPARHHRVRGHPQRDGLPHVGHAQTHQPNRFDRGRQHLRRSRSLVLP